jgi:anti-sigma factor RsiW
MRCHHVQQRLVAYQDRELSPGERTQVDDHLRTCDRCQTDEDALFAVTPQAQLIVPWHLKQQLRDQVDIEILWALAQAKPEQTVRSERWARWWTRHTELSRMSVAVYAALLLGALAWGGLNWQHASLLEAEIARHEIVDSVSTSPPTKIPATQYKPASYTPKGDDTYR